MKNDPSPLAKTYPLRGLILCMLLWVGLPAKGQPGEQIRLSTQQDTGDIMRHIKDARLLMINNPDTAITILSHALLLSRDLHYGKGERNALLNLAKIYYQLREYPKSIRMSEDLIKASDTILNKDAIFFAYYYMGSSSHRDGDYTLAFNAYTRALYYAQGSARWTIGIYNNLGELFRVNNQTEKALEYFNKAIHVNNNSGGLYNGDLISVYSNAARVYTGKGDFKDASTFYDSAEAIAIRLHQPEELFHINLGQANLANFQGEPKRALAYVQKARKTQKNIKPNAHLKHHPDLYAGEAYIRIPRYDLAEKYYLRALEMVDSNNLNDRILITHQLSSIYGITEDYEKAFKFHISSHNLLEQIKNKEVQAKLNEAEIRYKTAEKDKAIALQSVQLLESKRQLARKNFWMLSIAAGAVIFILAALLIILQYRRKRKIEAQEKEIDQLKAMMNGEEKERVRLSRELHDGVGSMLAAIKMNAGSIRSAYQQGIPVGDGLDKIITMLQETSSEVRTTAHNLMPDVLTRYDLQEAVIQYIQKVNSSHDIRIDFHVPEPLRDLNKPAELLLYRMIQELIQNVLKHAEATHIEVQLLQLGNEISLMVEDNGKGMHTTYVETDKDNLQSFTDDLKPEEHNVAASIDIEKNERDIGKNFSDTGARTIGTYDSNIGYGLDNLKYRVHALQGQLIVNSRPGKGTAVSISFDREKLKKITT